MTGGDVPTAVAAMKGGAVDFLLKPFGGKTCSRCWLPRRDGLPNKAIGGKLAISLLTVEFRRANAMRKLRARSFPDALELAFEAGLLLNLPESEAGPELSFDRRPTGPD